MRVNDLDRACTFKRRRLPRIGTVGVTGSHTDSFVHHPPDYLTEGFALSEALGTDAASMDCDSSQTKIAIGYLSGVEGATYGMEYPPTDTTPNGVESPKQRCRYGKVYRSHSG